MNLSGLTGSPTRYCFHLHSRGPTLPCKRTLGFQDQGTRRDFLCLERRNSLNCSTRRFITKRISVNSTILLLTLNAVIFPRININDPYKRLGISKEASEDEIQSARTFLVQKYAGHKPSVNYIRSAQEVGTFIVSWLLGTFLMVSVIPPVLKGPRSLEVTTSLVTYTLLWVSSTYLK
ncbi:putative protein CHAPERONE-LIKE PROTEIN OF POR1 [Helianthus annuus]|uniref:Uncharacterized protein n=1 Tax=Helianthus annuus TaxID=4232 RepID=A0A251SVK2_HELAN|nr:putative protein CHAPERONE-LIKE PROTEIN OF POR1 [Helianthus annuus]KAJ0556752.1 putative protein CHAPERONE-LIKE PROTEIN OF POR1 [Helianthus annuus]KAJ0904663.1 putative protein CHAPERONE-LIKE PROTEIN OF POR1 [Helianthus annuus]